MGVILGILLTCIVIYRLYIIGKIMTTQDFLVGTISIFAFSYFLKFWANLFTHAWKIDYPVNDGLIPAIILMMLCYMIKKCRVLENRRVEVKGFKVFLSFLPLAIALLFIRDDIAKDVEFGVYCIPAMIFMYFYKPFRVPWFVCVNILLLGLLAFNVTNNDSNVAIDTGDANLDFSGLDSSTNIDAYGVATMAMAPNVSVDTPNLDASVPTIDTSFSNVDANLNDVGSSNVDNSSQIISNENTTNANNPSGSTTISSLDESSSLTLKDGIVTDERSMQVGSYGEDMSTGNIAFKDQTGNIVGSIDPNTGNTYDENNIQNGNVNDLGAVTVYTDSNGNQAMKLNMEDSVVIDGKTGEPIAKVKSE